MNSFRTFLTLVGVAVLLASQAQADILFIDLNCSASEIAAAQKAAAARGEKLVVLPKRTPEQQKIYARIHDLELEAEQPGAGMSRLRELDAEKDALKKQTRGHVAFKMTELQSTLGTYAKTGRSFETVIISGHHGNEEFWGNFGKIPDEMAVAGAFSKYPSLLNAVRSYYGWGCYSNTPFEAMAWSTAFPRLRVTGGFDGGAPGPETHADSGFLAALLAKESLLDKISDKESAKEEMKQLAGVVRAINDFNETNASVCTCDQCVSKTSGELALDGLQGCDAKALKQIQLAEDVAFPYRSTNPPCNTQNSPLRTLYNLLREKSYCAKKLDEFRTFVAGADVTLHQIYLRQVLKNFDLYHAAELRRVNALASQCAPDIQIPDLKRVLGCTPPAQTPSNELSFNDLLKTSKALSEMEQVPKCVSNPADKTLLAHFSCHLGADLYFSPNSWVDAVDKASQLSKPNDSCDLPNAPFAGGMGLMGAMAP